MRWRMVAAACGGVVLVICAGLALSNPSLPRYQNSILTPLAQLEAEKLAQADRHAIEKEAAMIYSIFASVHYDAHKLDAATLGDNHPWLGASIAHQNEAEGRTFAESLALAKQRAFSQVDLIRQTVFHEVLEKLTTHTTRTSHGLWSTFATCGAGRALSYTGVAGTFVEQPQSNCPPEGSAK